VTELVDYLATHVPHLTGNLQTPGREGRFESDVFVSGLSGGRLRHEGSLCFARFGRY
jgi:hypothetical protein